MTTITPSSVTPNAIDFILRAVCDEMAINEKAVRSSRRTGPIAIARQTCMYLIRVYTKMKLEAIATEFQKRHHKTVIHACEAVKNRALCEPQFHDQLDRLIIKCNKEFNK